MSTLHGMACSHTIRDLESLDSYGNKAAACVKEAVVMLRAKIPRPSLLIWHVLPALLPGCQRRHADAPCPSMGHPYPDARKRLSQTATGDGLT